MCAERPEVGLVEERGNFPSLVLSRRFASFLSSRGGHSDCRSGDFRKFFATKHAAPTGFPRLHSRRLASSAN